MQEAGEAGIMEARRRNFLEGRKCEQYQILQRRGWRYGPKDPTGFGCGEVSADLSNIRFHRAVE